MRIGLVGFGVGGRLFHLPYLQAATEWELAGVVARSPQRVAELAAEAPGVPAFASLDAIIDAGVDAVVITTPPATRRELVLRALQRGVHVVADKPFAPDAATARELIAAADRAGRTLTVFHNRRWDTDLVTLRSVLDSGRLGRVWRADFALEQDDRSVLAQGPDEGLLRDLGAHVVDQLTQLFGPVARVDAHLDWVGAGDARVDVGFVLGLHHAGGVYSSVSSSKGARREDRRMIVYGREGNYESHMSDVQVEQLRAGLRPATDADAWGVEAPERWGVLHDGSGPTPIPSLRGDYTDFYRDLHRAIATGTPPAVRLSEALHTVAVLDAARESAISGTRVEVAATP
ncbi:Gfo/Idh/MocA family oxidoreductase [Leucobacter allii]|uniref:Gfo/Idh/MocA family protein n=1 Tax=Leucobacter allii TaxID=2932247 RepID=UPI001FCF9862|nr:Gfo/Idh/MocA family oxidoreductase [Leucobacter allii]UOR01626.1 Gfo/Idh/MocA family oxidoreductase [Leucobacter allii]